MAPESDAPIASTGQKKPRKTRGILGSGLARDLVVSSLAAIVAAIVATVGSLFIARWTFEDKRREDLREVFSDLASAVAKQEYLIDQYQHHMLDMINEVPYEVRDGEKVFAPDGSWSMTLVVHTYSVSGQDTSALEVRDADDKVVSIANLCTWRIAPAARTEMEDIQSRIREHMPEMSAALARAEISTKSPTTRASLGKLRDATDYASRMSTFMVFEQSARLAPEGSPEHSQLTWNVKVSTLKELTVAPKEFRRLLAEVLSEIDAAATSR